jgi:hypothetical protein
LSRNFEGIASLTTVLSSMVIYDADATLATTAYEVIILVGYVGTITGGATGVMTLG